MQPLLASEGLTGFPVHAAVKPLPANLNEVCRDMFEDLAEHVKDGFCVNGCADCKRWFLVREILLRPFEPSAWRPN